MHCYTEEAVEKARVAALREEGVEIGDTSETEYGVGNAGVSFGPGGILKEEFQEPGKTSFSEPVCSREKKKDR